MDTSKPIEVMLRMLDDWQDAELLWSNRAWAVVQLSGPTIPFVLPNDPLYVRNKTTQHRVWLELYHDGQVAVCRSTAKNSSCGPAADGYEVREITWEAPHDPA